MTINREFKGAIFDLDGVLVDTAKYHYEAWKMLAEQLGFDFTMDDNERLKGVSRMQSLEILLEIGGITISDEKKMELAEQKNACYVRLIKEIDESELLMGAKEYLYLLKGKGIKIALGSASKNAMSILNNLGIVPLFDAIIDGNKVNRTKPDPEVFTKAVDELGLTPSDCIVFEDAVAGIEAAKNAGISTVGIGDRMILKDADFVVKGLYELI